MCQPLADKPDDDTKRNGINTNTPKFTATKKKDAEKRSEYQSRKNGDNDNNRGLHESWEWYDKCRRRERNGGEFFFLLFLVDLNFLTLQIYMF